MELEKIKKIVKEEISQFIPIGTIQCFSINNLTPLFGMWMPCDGRRLNKDNFPDLFTAIGYTFGGSGKYFYLPDLRGRFIRGWDSGGNIDGGREFGSTQEDALQGHLHGFDPEQLITSKDGSHVHLMGARTIEVVKTGGQTRVLESLTEGELNQGHTYYNGFHTHKIECVDSPIENPIDSAYGSVRYTNETRPHNIALHFCIRAE